jgi:hypothetical protein
VKALIRHDIRTRSGVHRIEQALPAFDELVIPGRLHIEAMGNGVWHVAADGVTLSVGPRHVTVVEIDGTDHAACKGRRCRCPCRVCVRHRERLARVDEVRR